MKACIIIPPNPILYNPTMNVPLGVLYLGAAIDKEGHDIYMTDMRAEHGLNFNLIPRGYDLYGVTSTTGEYYYAKELSKYLKTKEKDAIRIIGGPHTTHKPVETLKDTDYDISVIGEGENTVIEILEEKDLYNIKGIAFKDNNSSCNITVNEKRELIKNLDTIPFPARNMLPYDHIFSPELYYGERYGSGEIGTSFITSRGCPHNCSYCANWDRGLRLRSIENVIKEIQECINLYKCRHFRIVDDEFGIPEKRGIKLCEEMESLDIKFRTHTRADAATPELIDALKKAGCEELSFGIETPDESLLKLANKKQTLQQCKTAIKIAKDAGLRVKTYLMVCLPGETWDSINKVKTFVTDSKPDKWTLSTCIPYPGCDLEKNPSKYGIRILEKDYSKYWLYQDDPMFETDVATISELKEHRIELMKWLTEYDKKKVENDGSYGIN